MRSSVWPDELRTTRRSWMSHSTSMASASESCHGCTVKRTRLPSSSSTSKVWRAELRAPVSILTLIHGTPMPGSSTHSRQPTATVFEWRSSAIPPSWQEHR